MSSSAVVSALSAMATGHPHNVVQPMVRISSPVFVHVIPNNTQEREEINASTHQESLELLESFMTEWSIFVGDPILSKWIVIALNVSILLNWYLLKGLATSLFVSSPPPCGLTFASVTDGLDAKQTKRRRSSSGTRDLNAQKDARAGDAESERLSSLPTLTLQLSDSTFYPRSSGVEIADDTNCFVRRHQPEGVTGFSSS